MLITTFGWRPSQSRADLYWVCCFLVLLQRSTFFLLFTLIIAIIFNISIVMVRIQQQKRSILRICEYEKRKWDTDAYALCTGVWCEWYNWIKESIYSLKFIGGWLFFVVLYLLQESHISLCVLYVSSLLLSCGALCSAVSVVRIVSLVWYSFVRFGCVLFGCFLFSFFWCVRVSARDICAFWLHPKYWSIYASLVAFQPCIACGILCPPHSVNINILRK